MSDYIIKESYKFDVVELRGSHLVVSDKKKNTYRVKMLPFLNEEDLGKKVSCIVDGFAADGSPKLIMSKAPFLDRIYKVGEIYPFKVGVRVAGTRGFDSIRINDDYGFFAKIQIAKGAALPPDLKNFRITSINAKKGTFTVEIPKEELESSGSDQYTTVHEQGRIDIPEEFSMEALKADSDFEEVIWQLDQKDCFWVITLANVIRRKRDRMLRSGLIQAGYRANKYMIELNRYVFEDSKFLNHVSGQVKASLQENAETNTNLAIKQNEVLGVILQGRSEEFLDDIAHKLNTSGFIFNSGQRLWMLSQLLTLNPDLIDAHFAKILPLLKLLSQHTSVNLLLTPICEALHNKVAQALISSDMEILHGSQGRFRDNLEPIIGSILALWIIAAQAKITNTYLAQQCSAVLRYISITSPLLRVELNTLAIRIAVTNVIPEPTYNWKDLENMNLPAIASKLSQMTPPAAIPDQLGFFDGRGCALLDNGRMAIIPTAQRGYELNWFNYSEVLPILDGVLSLMIPKSDRPSATAMKSIPSLRTLYSGFFLSLDSLELTDRSTLMKYAPDSELAVRVTKTKIFVGGREAIAVESIDPSYEKISGTIVLESIYFTKLRDWGSPFKVGDTFMVSCTATDEQKGRASFYMQNHICDYLGRTIRKNDSVKCFLASTQGTLDTWKSSEGYNVYVAKTDVAIEEGSFAMVRILGVNEQGYARGVVGDLCAEPFDITAAFSTLIRGYIEEKDHSALAISSDQYVDYTLMREVLLSLVMLCDGISNPVERYKTFAFIRALSYLTENDLIKKYMAFRMRHLENLIAFADGNGEDTSELYDEAILSIDGVQERIDTHHLLSLYGRADSTEEVAKYVNGESLINKSIAKLVMMSNLAIGVLPESHRSGLKREILSLLNIEQNIADDYTDLTRDYIGVEDHHTEFKTSILYDSDNSSSMAATQIGNIMETVASFLNADGGKILIGVDDAGYITGTERDKMRLQVNDDKYELYLRTQIIEAFGLDISSLITIQSVYDGRVVSVEIPSADHIVAYKNIVWQRQGNGKRMLSGLSRQAAENRKLKKHKA